MSAAEVTMICTSGKGTAKPEWALPPARTFWISSLR